MRICRRNCAGLERQGIGYSCCMSSVRMPIGTTPQCTSAQALCAPRNHNGETLALARPLTRHAAVSGRMCAVCVWLEHLHCQTLQPFDPNMASVGRLMSRHRCRIARITARLRLGVLDPNRRMHIKSRANWTAAGIGCVGMQTSNRRLRTDCTMRGHILRVWVCVVRLVSPLSVQTTLLLIQTCRMRSWPAYLRLVCLLESAGAVWIQGGADVHVSEGVY